jgi:uncharacterized protein
VARHHLSRRDARRVAVRAQWLHRDRPADLLGLVRQIALLPIEPTAAIAPSADLVAWSRLGAPYHRSDLDRALRNRELIEFRTTIRPAEDLALYGAEMAAWPGPGPLRDWQQGQRDWVQANDACRLDILRRLDGPAPYEPGSCRTRVRSPGSPRGGPTTRTSANSWISWSGAARWPSPADAGMSGYGTWRSASIPTFRSSR